MHKYIYTHIVKIDSALSKCLFKKCIFKLPTTTAFIAGCKNVAKGDVVGGIVAPTNASCESR